MKNVGGNRYQLENNEQFTDHWIETQKVAAPEIVRVEAFDVGKEVFVQFHGETTGFKVGVPLNSLDVISA